MAKQNKADKISGERYKRFFERAPIGLYQTSLAGEILDANPALVDMLGYADRQSFLAARADQIYINPADRQRWQAVMERDGLVRNVELQLRRADGRPIWVRDNARLIRDPEGNPLYYEGTLEDISERKQAEMSLHKERRQLHQVISSMPNLLIRVDEQDRLSAFAAPANFPSLLAASDSPIHTPLVDLLPPDVAGQILHALNKARETGQPSKFEYSIADGKQQAYFEIKVSSISDSREALVMADNITDRKLAEIAEREQRHFAQVLSDIAITVNTTIELDQVLDLILSNLERVVPYESADIMLLDGDSVRMVGRKGRAEPGMTRMPSERYALAEIGNFREMIESGQPMLIPDTRLHPGWKAIPGTEWIRSYAGCPIQINRENIGFINLDSSVPDYFSPAHLERLRAITAQAAVAIHNAQLFQSIQSQAKELEIANRELEAFSHTVAHDLKAPLQVSVGYASVLQAEYASVIDEDGQSILAEIKAAGFRMSSMIESLLLLAKLRDVQETLTTVEMRPVVDGALARFPDRIKERGIAVEVMPDLPPALGYGPWLEEVFANLIGNAIKYMNTDNPAPRISVRGRRIGSMARYEIEDNGLGIPLEAQERLFEQFSRFHTGHVEGFGLGLSIVLRIITRLNGQIGVVSAPGQGSTFWFALPVPPEPA